MFYKRVIDKAKPRLKRGCHILSVAASLYPYEKIPCHKRRLIFLPCQKTLAAVEGF